MAVFVVCEGEKKIINVTLQTIYFLFFSPQIIISLHALLYSFTMIIAKDDTLRVRATTIDFSLHHHGAPKKNTRTEIISKYLTVLVHMAVVLIKKKKMCTDPFTHFPYM